MTNSNSFFEFEIRGPFKWTMVAIVLSYVELFTPVGHQLGLHLQPMPDWLVATLTITAAIFHALFLIGTITFARVMWANSANVRRSYDKLYDEFRKRKDVLKVDMMFGKTKQRTVLLLSTTWAALWIVWSVAAVYNGLYILPLLFSYIAVQSIVLVRYYHKTAKKICNEVLTNA